MNNQDLAQKIRVLRNRKGYSQEELAEKTGLSLRTIQRIENGETEPQGNSLTRLAAIFDVSREEIADWTMQEDNRFRVSLNLSALGFLIIPILGILIPLILWISRKDKIRKLNESAKDLLNFQIIWIIGLFIGNIILIMKTAFKMKILGDINAGLITSMLVSITIFTGIMYLFNLTLIIVNSIRINNERTTKYYPKIRFLKK